MAADQDTQEEKVSCPIDRCNEEVMSRGLFIHTWQTDDPPGTGHYPRGEVPPGFREKNKEVTGKEEVDIDYPDTQNLEDLDYLDTYTGKTYSGKRGLMIHLGQMAGKENIPESITENREAHDFPIVEVDDDGNITEVKEWPSDKVPSIKPYLPWFDDSDDGYVKRERIKNFVEEVRKSPTGAASAEVIEERLLEETTKKNKKTGN